MKKINKILAIFNHKGFKKYSANTSWLVGDKIIKLFLGFFIGVWVARYLGPEKFGIFNYVLALMGFLVPFTKFGFDGIITRNIIRREEDINILISSAFVFKLIGSVIASLILVLYLFFKEDDLIYFYLGVVFSLKFIFQPFEVIELYYRAKVKSKHIFYSKLIGELFSSTLKVVIILLGSSLVYFVGAHVSLFIVTALFLMFFFRKESTYLSFKFFSLKRGIGLLKESWPLIFSGVFAILYLSVDKIMIAEMLNDYELGQYSVAVKISSVWYFIPLYIRMGILPALVNAKKKSEELYYKRLGLVFSSMTLLSYLIIIPISLFSNDIINFLFGTQYNEAGDVLRIHIFSLLFFFLGIGRGLWVTNESNFKFDLFANVLGGLVNILLNYLWLPKYGIMGAAYATLISFSFTFFFSNLFTKTSRRIFVMQLRSIFLGDLIAKYIFKNT